MFSITFTELQSAKITISVCLNWLSLNRLKFSIKHNNWSQLKIDVFHSSLMWSIFYVNSHMTKQAHNWFYEKALKYLIRIICQIKFHKIRIRKCNEMQQIEIDRNWVIKCLISTLVSSTNGASLTELFFSLLWQQFSMMIEAYLKLKYSFVYCVCSFFIKKIVFFCF